MLKQIIDNISRNDKTSKDNCELPRNFPSPNTKFVKHQAVFGQVRVELPKKSEQRQMIEQIYKNYDPTNEEYQKFDARIWSLVDDDMHMDKNDIDFYGLMNSHYRNNSFEKKISVKNDDLNKSSCDELTPTNIKVKESKVIEEQCLKDNTNDQLASSTIKIKENEIQTIEDNYIDQLAFPTLTTKKTEVPTKSIEKETIEDLKNEQMNFVDEQYFSTLKEIKYHDKQQTDITIPTKRIEMPPKDELNYIDQLVFSSSTSSKIEEKKISKNENNEFLDVNFQYRIAKPNRKETAKPKTELNETSMSTFNPKLESMRSIKSKDYFDPPRKSALDVQMENETESATNATEPAEQIRQQLTKKNTTRDSLGYRIFDCIVPNWSAMTKAEIVDVLVKQICFIQRGPGINISIAHCIPQIIERLNRPEIRQLHLLHRLDKQSTGVLLMAYTPEAEKRLRELMEERQLIKQYIAIVRGIPKPSEGEINIPIVERNIRGTYKMMLSPEYTDLTKLVMPKSKRDNINSSAAITKYRVIDSNYNVSLVECQPITGVKHQIRTHLAHGIGTPILGDHKYSHYGKLAPQKLQFATLKKLGVRQAKVRTIPLCLHSYSVAIPNFLHHQQNIFIRARLSHHLRYFIQCFRLKMIK